MKKETKAGELKSEVASLLDATFYAIEYAEFDRLSGLVAELEKHRSSEIEAHYQYYCSFWHFKEQRIQQAVECCEAALNLFEQQKSELGHIWYLSAAYLRVKIGTELEVWPADRVTASYDELFRLIENDYQWRYVGLKILFGKLRWKSYTVQFQQEAFLMFKSTIEMVGKFSEPVFELRVLAIGVYLCLLLPRYDLVEEYLAAIEKLMQCAERRGLRYYMNLSVAKFNSIEQVALEVTDVYVTALSYQMSLYTQIASYERALDVAQRVKELIDVVPNPSILASYLSTIARLYHDTGDYLRELEILQELEQFMEQSNSLEHDYFIVRQNVAQTMLNVHRYDEAEKRFSELLQLSEQRGYNDIVSNLLLNLGHLCYTTGRNDEAIRHLQRALVMGKRFGDSSMVCASLFTLAEVYMHLDTDKAYDFMSKAMVVAKEFQLQQRIQELHLLQSRYFKLTGNLAEALQHYETHVQLKEKQFKESTYSRYSNFNVLYKTDRLLRQAEEKAEELEKVNAVLESTTQKLEEREKEMRKLAFRVSASQEFIQNLKRGLTEVVSRQSKNKSRQILALLNAIKHHETRSINLNEFEDKFMDVNRDLAAKVIEVAPDISNVELRVCVLMSMSLNSKQIADMLQVSFRTVENHRTHIRRKLRLPKGESLTNFLISLA